MVRRNNTSIITILRRYSKVITAFLVVNFLTSLVYPIASFALTSGPTAPDYTSFEPVDVTDMVDVMTGDFTYNLPLLEVPGPSGGYPISLGYHAGIPVDQEASWVGLGWTLNPGAINRSVNGFADDQINGNNVTRQFWSGGNIDESKVGLTVGIPGSPVSVSAGISVARDSYRGLKGVGYYSGAGLRYGQKGLGLNLGYTYGDNPVTGFSQNGSLGVSYSSNAENTGVSIGGSAGLSTNFSSVSAGFNAGVSAVSRGGASASLLGAGISSSNGGSVSLSVAGFSGNVHNANAGRISSVTRGFGISIPIYKGVWLDYAKTNYRYWIDEMNQVSSNGALNFDGSEADLDNTAFDIYSIPDEDLFNFNVDDTDKTLGGTFAEYDQYGVTGQGIGGAIRPYAFQRHLYRQNKGEDVIHYETGSSTDRAEFRFVGDFSNRYEYDAGTIQKKGEGGVTDPVAYTFGSPRTGAANNATDGLNGTKLYGSRDIDYFSNAEIVGFKEALSNGGTIDPKFMNFVDNQSTGFNRSTDADDQIGAFVITNESGVRYHYTLPAYAFGEENYSERLDLQPGEKDYNFTRKSDKYAYIWHLTAITGPDYVDRGGGAGNDPDGFLGEEDWGYWVEFDYGYWTNEYYWRNPGVGYNRDLDGNFRNVSIGIKELFYLDAVRTKTHTALFHKSIRADGKSRKFHTGLGGSPSASGFLPSLDHDFDGELPSEFVAPVPSMKLDRISLIQNKYLPEQSLAEIKASGTDYCLHEDDQTAGGSCSGSAAIDIVSFNKFYSSNVLDNVDLGLDDLQYLRTIKFNYSYELQPETINSYDSGAEIYLSPQTANLDVSENLLGKLTLTGVEFEGKNGTSLIPETTFNYDLDDEGHTTTITSAGSFFRNLSSEATLQDYSGLTEGDLIKVTRTTDGEMGYFFIDRWALGLNLKPLNNSSLATGDPVLVQKTKNIPYNSETKDIWGMFKADVDLELCDDNETLARMVTEESKRNLDVWSLRKIKSPLGAEINIQYQPDRYEEVAMAPATVFQVSNVRDGAQSNWIEIEMPYTEQAYEFITQYSFMDLSLAAAYRYHPSAYSFPDNPELTPNDGSSSPYHQPEKWTHDSNPNFQNYTKIFPVNLRAYVQQKSILGDKILLSLSMPILEYNKITGSKEHIEYDRVSEYDNFNQGNSTLLPGNFKVDYNFQGWPSFILGGYASKSLDQSGGIVFEGVEPGAYGGGIAVKSISLYDLIEGETTRTNYTYNHGVTSYEPYGILPAQPSDEIPEWFENPEVRLGRVSYHQYLPMINNARDIPAPGVIYGNVKIDKMAKGNAVPGYTTYEFETFKPGMIDVFTYSEQLENEDTNQSYGDIDYQRTQRRSLAIKDFTARIGNLISITRYDASDHKISSTTNHYLSGSMSDDSFNAHVNEYENDLRIEAQNQGVVEETFIDARFAQQETDDRYYLLATLAKKERFPSVMIGTTIKDYKTGIESSSQYLDFDYYSGKPLLTYSEDEHGNQYINQSIPAYSMLTEALGISEKAYPAMGLKGKDVNNKNMITQEGVMVSFKMNDNYELGDSDWKNKIDGIMSGSITTWEDGSQIILPGGTSYTGDMQEDIYRKNSSYSFIGTSKTAVDGTHQLTNGYDALKASWTLYEKEPDLAYGWQKGGRITLYDIHSNALEAVDINGNYGATRLDLDQERVIANASNATYGQFAYTGFEDGSSGVSLGSNLELLSYQGIVIEDETNGLRPHTGKASLHLYEGHEGLKFTVIDPDFPRESGNRNYMVSVWSSKNDGLDINYVIGTDAQVTAEKLPTKQAGDWFLHRAIIPWEESGLGILVISLEAHDELRVDDFRAHPVDAVMTSYVYNEWGEMSFQLDPNNLFTQYIYDNEGRLQKVYRESFKHGVKQVSDFKIHYAELDEITQN